MHQEMAQKRAAPPPAGLLLQQAPSWLHQLIVSLPATEKLALFRTCMQLATQVVASAPKLMLQLGRQARPYSHKNNSRRSLATLLTSRRSFALAVQARDTLPFPVELSRQVTEVRLEYSKPGPASSWLDWGDFTSLKTLRLLDQVTFADLTKLCVALEGGHLSKLHHLRWDSRICGTGLGPHSPDSHMYERLCRALGSRITFLHTSGYALLRFCQHLTCLHSIEVRLPDDSAQFPSLVTHSSLQSVSLLWSNGTRTTEPQTVRADFSRCPCTWRSLHLVGMQHPAVLLRLPIANLKELHIHKQLESGNEQDVKAVRLVVDSLLDRVKLVPEWDGLRQQLLFRIKGLKLDTVAIVGALKCDCWLSVDWDRELGLHTSAFIPALWASLNSSVSGVQLRHLNHYDNVKWASFWNGIPHTVKHLELTSFEFYFCDPIVTTTLATTCTTLCSLVAHTPEHVCSLKLFGLHTCVRIACETAGIHKAAPKHLQFELTSEWW